MHQLVFATNNLHKLEEAEAKLGNSIQLLSLTGIGCTDDIEETGSTFIENASIKSNYIFGKYQLNCFSDDSGLEVDALNGEPGVYSARYAGVHRDHEANINKLLQNLIGKSDRNARFKTVISLMLNDEEHIFEGAVEGTIARQRSGAKGFGYDPVFMPDGYSITFAEMTLKEKNSISHRGRALDKMAAFLKRVG